MEHIYLSTACLHDLHEQCGCRQRERGDVSPAHCKYCAAECICPCHADPPEVPE